MKRFLADRRPDILIALAFLIVSGTLYFFIARDFSSLTGYSRYPNILFDADHTDALQGWVEKHKGNHPLVLLLVVPLCSVLGKLCGSYVDGLFAFCGLTGGATVAAFYGLVRMIVDRHPAIAVTAFFAVSMNQIFFASIPDTYELVALSLIPSFALTLYCLRSGKLHFTLWVVAGLLSFSITSVSLVQTLICLAVVLYKQGDLGRAVKVLPAAAAIVLLIAVVLNLVQYWIFPDSKLFFVSDVYEHEMRYVTPLILDHPGVVAAETIKTFLFYSFLGQEPLVRQFDPGSHGELVYFRAPIDYGWTALVGAALWLALFVRGLRRSLGDRQTVLLTWAAILSVLSNAALFSFYSTDEMYLYTPHFSFITILIAVSRRSMNRRYVVAAWWVLAILAASNNLATQRDVTKLYGAGTEVIVPAGAEWRYFVGLWDPGDDWMEPSYDDSGWKSGPSGFGYGDLDDATVLDQMKNRCTVVFTRHSFELEGVDPRQELLAFVDFDDGFVMYLNGVEVAGQNAPRDVSYRSRALRDREAGQPIRFRIPISHAREGSNTLAVAGLNGFASSSDLSLKVVLWRAARQRY